MSESPEPESRVARLLKSYVGESPGASSPSSLEQEVATLCDNFITAGVEKKTASSKTIPTFYKPKPKPNSLQYLLRSEARMRCLQLRNEAVLGDVKQLWLALGEVDGTDEEERRINYDVYSQIATNFRELFGNSCDSYFKASTFMRFSQDGNGSIPASLFLQYLYARNNMQKLHVDLSYCDEQGTGVLSESQLEEYIRSLIPDLPALERMQPSFVQYYKRIAARKFMFFNGKNGMVRIRDLINSHVISELMELKQSGMSDSALMSNWFSLQSTQRVYNTFLALDEDMNGMLNRQEFSQISNGTMSPLFISRVFEEHVLRQKPARGNQRDEMDLVAFTDFVLAWDHRNHPAAIKYFFQIFDLQKKGLVQPVDVYTFFKEIHVMWVEMGEYSDLSVYDVIDELLDMIKPKQSPDISPEDLANCNMSGIFFSVLSDVKQFYDYNYRENQMQHNEDDQ